VVAVDLRATVQKDPRSEIAGYLSPVRLMQRELDILASII